VSLAIGKQILLMDHFYKPLAAAQASVEEIYAIEPLIPWVEYVYSPPYYNDHATVSGGSWFGYPVDDEFIRRNHDLSARLFWFERDHKAALQNLVTGGLLRSSDTSSLVIIAPSASFFVFDAYLWDDVDDLLQEVQDSGESPIQPLMASETSAHQRIESAKTFSRLFSDLEQRILEVLKDVA
jgi:hypothetical protein